jgi:hypothetical protein
MFAKGTPVRVTRLTAGHDAKPGIYKVESFVSRPPLFIEGEDQESFYFVVNGDWYAYSARHDTVEPILKLVSDG